jgi:urease alpha subunit
MEDRTMRLAEAKNMIRSPGVITVLQRVALWAIVMGALTLPATKTFAQSAGACADSTNATTVYYRDYYRVAASSTTSTMVAFRSQTGLPNLAETQVRLVGDTIVCRNASSAVDAKTLNQNPATPVIVLELGTKRIVIKDVGLSGGRLNFLFNQDFSTLLYRMVF